MEKAKTSEGLTIEHPAGSCQLSMNDARTCGKIDTRLTQPRSADVLTAVQGEEIG
jgi:hypothetical protein